MGSEQDDGLKKIADILRHTEERLNGVEFAVQDTLLTKRLLERVENLEKLTSGFVKQKTDLCQFDLAHFGCYYLYVFEDDYVNYGMFPPEQKKQSVAAIASGLRKGFTLPSTEKMNAKEYTQLPHDMLSVFAILFWHCREAGLKPDFVDVGANIGAVSLPMAGFLESFSPEAHTYSFEPGQANSLLRANIVNNRLAGKVTLQKTALGDFAGCVAMSNTAGFTVSNGVTNEQLRRDLVCHELVDAQRLDTVFQAHSNPLICKIDTEGNDAAVLRGLERIIGDKVSALLFEYTPALMKPAGEDMVAPLMMLVENGFSLYSLHTTLKEREAGKGFMRWEPIGNRARKIAQFLERVNAEFQFGQTDILAISDRIPRWNELPGAFSRWLAL